MKRNKIFANESSEGVAVRVCKDRQRKIIIISPALTALGPTNCMGYGPF